MCFQGLGGKREEISVKDLAYRTYDLYLLMLQKLKQKGIEIENFINETEDISDLEEQFLKVIPTMNMVRTLVN